MPGGPPLPFAAGGRVLVLDCGSLMQAVDMVMLAFRRSSRFLNAIGSAMSRGIVRKHLFKHPAEATGLVLVASLDDEKNSSDLKESGPYE